MSSTLNLQRTLAIIKPHAIHHRSAIIRRIQIAGFQILQVLNRFRFNATSELN